MGETEKNDERKVPDRHPIQRLNSLVKFSHELLDDWFSFLPSQARWKDKFEINAARMEKIFFGVNKNVAFTMTHFFMEDQNRKIKNRQRRNRERKIRKIFVNGEILMKMKKILKLNDTTGLIRERERDKLLPDLENGPKDILRLVVARQLINIR